VLNARPHIEPLMDKDVPWKKLRLPGIPSGQLYRTLSVDPEAGSCTLTVRFEKGFSQPPGFSRGEREIFILKGSLKVGEKVSGPGAYLFVPKGVALPAITSPRGCEALVMYNDAAPDFVDSDASDDGANEAGLIQVQSYDDIHWKESTIFPMVETGCLIKILRYDLPTGAMTFLYNMVPGYWQDNVSFHDCMEEGYHIVGTSWMLQFGDLPDGAYFWRPPYINHGPFASSKGCLGFGRTDGFLFNHFHWNPWTNQEENTAAAHTRDHLQRPALMKWLKVKGCAL
jgi:hypothetical protein